jgi:hypothetical protein
MSDDTSDSATVALAELSDAVRRATTDVVWIQWRAIGGHAATRVRARSLIDPEALVLMSLMLAPAEPRLGELVSDWAILNAPLLSVQRIKNLMAEGPADAHGRVGAFARLVLAEAKDIRWRSLATAGRAGGALTRRTNKTRAREASLLDDAALWLRLRLGLGVGIKADTMAFLLGGSGTWATVRMVATATSYTPPAVRRAVDDLARAGLVLSRSRPHTPAEYSARGTPWAAALGLKGPLPPWRNWYARFTFATAFLTWAEKARTRNVSRYAFGAHAGDLLAQHASAFDQNETSTRSPNPKAPDRAERVEQAVQEFAERLVREA